MVKISNQDEQAQDGDNDDLSDPYVYSSRGLCGVVSTLWYCKGEIGEKYAIDNNMTSNICLMDVA